MSDKDINEMFERMFDDDAKAKLQMYDDLKEAGIALKGLYDGLVIAGFTESQALCLLGEILKGVAQGSGQGKE